MRSIKLIYFKKRAGFRAGFTLIELLLVVAIIGILAGLIIPRYAKRAEQSKLTAARADIAGNLSTALELYELDNGQFPTTEQSLQALIAVPTIPPAPSSWNGPYLRGQSYKDPWGNQYQYRSPATQSALEYELFSYGPDGAEGGGDDIRNWEEFE